MLAPIVIFVYNRLLHTQRTIDSLKLNELANESELIIFSDGRKNELDVRVNDVRDYLKSISGFKMIKVVERVWNYGLAQSIIEGVSEVLAQYDKIIVLEDDMVTSPYFLTYMNRSLDMYEQEKNVASIHGYIYPIKRELPPTFFIKGADCWGWATWSRAWAVFNPNGKELYEQILSRNLQREFNFNNSFDYLKMLENQIQGKNDSWAIRWYASTFLQNMYTLYPGKSLVYNIGNDKSGTHSEMTNRFDVELANDLDLKKIVVSEEVENRLAFEKYFKPSILTKFKQLILNFIL